MNDVCEYILDKVDLKIKKSVGSIPQHYQEDVEQDIKEKICKSTDKIKFEDVPGFFEFVEDQLGEWGKDG
ncbi:hypothetical protein [Bacillus sp. Marseille-P3800]|uniref:hypothetical protein n=1 Tax=Bacillus sp. Marseille-P3800 TaxID=2014782 RepID=UPI000C069712|nr:hypothetical protein [Bacillus sp. Marseille-P3800]